MKKSIALTIALAIGSLGAFGQGNILIQASHSIFGGTPGSAGSLAGAQFDYVALFAFTSSSAANAAANGAVSGTATTGSASGTLGLYNTATAWSSLLSGAIQVDNGTANTPSVTQIAGTTGTFAANGSTSWTASNLTAGNAYSCIMVAWSGAYTTVSAASTANALVGCSKVFTYTPAVPPGSAPSMTALVGTFGVGGTIAPTPEPGTMALAALGGASLLLFRRRK